MWGGGDDNKRARGWEADDNTNKKVKTDDADFGNAFGKKDDGENAFSSAFGVIDAFGADKKDDGMDMGAFGDAFSKKADDKPASSWMDKSSKPAETSAWGNSSSWGGGGSDEKPAGGSSWGGGGSSWGGGGSE